MDMSQPVDEEVHDIVHDLDGEVPSATLIQGAAVGADRDSGIIDPMTSENSN